MKFLKDFLYLKSCKIEIKVILIRIIKTISNRVKERKLAILEILAKMIMKCLIFDYINKFFII